MIMPQVMCYCLEKYTIDSEYEIMLIFTQNTYSTKVTKRSLEN